MINNENLKKVIENIIGDDDKLRGLIFDIVVKIDNLGNNKEINIADLINYDPRKNFIEPLTQGKIHSLVFDICKRMNITLVEIGDGLGGLAFYYHFKKIKNNKKTDVLNGENFQLNIKNCGVLFPTHPAYFDNRFVLNIDSEKATAEVEKNGYTLNEFAVSEIKSYILKVFKKIKALSKKKKEYYEGGESSSISLQYNGEKVEADCYIRQQRDFYRILDDIKEIVDKEISQKNAFQDENSPNPVKEAEMLVKEAEERRRKQEKQYFEALAEKHRKRLDLLKRLRTEKLYTSTESDSLFSGHYEYNPIVWEVFETVGMNSPDLKTYDNYLAKKSVSELSPKEIREQFLFWSRGERFCEGTIAEAIDSGNFVRLYEKLFGNVSEEN